MTTTRILFLALSGAILILGLFVARSAVDLPLGVFGWGLVLFGVFFGVRLVKQTMDEEETSQH
jgi:hypothetical protein